MPSSRRRAGREDRRPHHRPEPRPSSRGPFAPGAVVRLSILDTPKRWTGIPTAATTFRLLLGSSLAAPPRGSLFHQQSYYGARSPFASRRVPAASAGRSAAGHSTHGHCSNVAGRSRLREIVRTHVPSPLQKGRVHHGISFSRRWFGKPVVQSLSSGRHDRPRNGVHLVLTRSHRRKVRPFAIAFERNRH
jgi:hypothetical protein